MLRPALTQRFVATLVLLAVVALAVLAAAGLPPARPIDAAIGKFSVGRAWLDIAALVNLGPRPLRPRQSPPAPAHQQATALLFSRMGQLGLSPVHQQGERCNTRGSCFAIDNLLGRLDPKPGTAADSRAIVLLSHYDSVAAGPGAGDAASGVATVLEIVRALAATASLRRPLLVVLDDGEELGMLGAELLVRHPWVAEAAIVLNFEARGTSGQTAMFETSAHSHWLVAAYGQAVRQPLASSLIATLYKLLPNDTDLTVTNRAGLLGLNFAFADGEWNYHTAADDLGHLDPQTVQHMGDQGLAIAKALVERPTLPEATPADSDAVWFDLLSQRLIVYRQATAQGLALLLLASYAGLLGLLFRRRQLAGLAGGGGRWLVLVLTSWLGGRLALTGIGLLATRPQPWRAAPLPTFVAIAAAAILAGSGLLLLRDRWPKRRPEALAVEPVVGQVVGMLGFTVALALGLTWRLVGTSYLWTLPGLATALPLLCWLLLPPPAMGRTAQQLWLLLLPGLLSTAVLWFTLLRIVRVMVGAQLPIAITLPVAVCLSAYEPLAQLATLRQRSLVLLAALLTLLSALVIAVG